LGLLTIYLMAAVASGWMGVRRAGSQGWSFLLPLRFAVMFHTVFLGLAWTEMGPMSMAHIIQAMGLSLGLMYLISIKRGDSQGLLVIIWPLLILLMVGVVVAPDGGILREEVAIHGKSIFLHIFLALMGYASFFMVTLCSFMYLMQSRYLKVNSNLPWLSKVPSLLELTDIKWRALTFGLVFFTLAIGLGKMSPYLWNVPHHWGAKEILSMMTWTLYLVLFVAKSYFRRHKEMFAYVSLLGCALLLLTLWVMKLSPFAMEELGR